MDSKKLPLLAEPVRELKRALAAMHDMIRLIESGDVEAAIGDHPPKEYGRRIGQVIGRVRKVSASAKRVCESVAEHTDLPSAKQLVDRF